MNHMKCFSTALFFIFLIVGLSCSPQQKSTAKITNHSLRVVLNPQEHKLTSVDTIKISYQGEENKISFFLHDSLKVIKIKTGEQELAFTASNDFDIARFMDQVDEDVRKSYERATLYQVSPPPQLFPEYIEIYYEGAIYDSVKNANFSRMMVADQTTGLIGEEGVFLAGESFWYPSLPQERASFRLATISPKGFRVVTSGELLHYEETADSVLSLWEEKNPIDTIYLCAGDYQVQSTSIDGIRISTYFFPQSQSLSGVYLQSCKRYIKMYNELLGPYPYKKFAVVENFFPTGYGMPSFTLLGSTVIRLPFITKISLGHEICHNWWGNGVFVDMLSGNWCEGLTVYCADYYYKKLESDAAARQYRYEILKDYASYVTSKDLDFPLVDFRERTTPATRVIGYGKSMMVFHQLHEMYGDELFWKGLRQIYKEKLFQFASWRDFQAIYENLTQQDLSWYFDQWITRPGAPQITLENPAVQQSDGKYMLSGQVVQKEPFYKIYLPVRVHTDNSTLDTVVVVGNQKTDFSMETQDKILRVELDPDYNVFRHLAWQEITPSLSQFFGASKQIIVLPGKASQAMSEAYSKFAEAMNRTKQAQIIEDKALTEKDYSNYAVMILGGPQENSAFKEFVRELPDSVILSENKITLFDDTFGQPDDCTVLVLRNPNNIKETIVWVWAHSEKAIAAVTRKLPHYGKYGFLAFRNGRNSLKGNWNIQNTLSYTF